MSSKEKKNKINITVYTDGSCLKSGGKIRCGYGIHFPNEELKDVGKPFLHDPLTNQRAELYAIYKALKKITENLEFDTISIYSDSEYSIKSMTVWIKNWKKNNWKTAGNKDVLNQDLIKKIDKILTEYPKKISFTHVRAHTGGTDEHSIGNDKADKLANTGALKN
jgi:ribonuclease HI